MWLFILLYWVTAIVILLDWYAKVDDPNYSGWKLGDRYDYIITIVVVLLGGFLLPIVAWIKFYHRNNMRRK